MRKISLYEIGDEVMVMAVVTGVTIEQGEIKYQIQNEITGRNYDHLFESGQLISVKKAEEDA